MTCTYDDFSVNSYFNRIINSTVLLLLKADTSSKRKKELRRLLAFFSGVDSADLHTVNWNICYNRNNQTYRMLISICFLAVKGLLHAQSNGTAKLMNFVDEQSMNRLYEKFILEYFRKEFPQIKASASHIKWQVDDGVRDMLPSMRTLCSPEGRKCSSLTLNITRTQRRFITGLTRCIQATCTRYSHI